MSSPILDYNLRLLECVEDLAVEQLIAQFAVEALAITILPRTARLDVSGSGPDGREPLPKGFGQLIVTKVHQIKGNVIGGIPFNYGTVLHILKNRIYLGETGHDGKWFAG